MSWRSSCNGRPARRPPPRRPAGVTGAGPHNGILTSETTLPGSAQTVGSVAVATSATTWNS